MRALPLFFPCSWGCAYRSLQTICSWFQRQHYTARAPPAHREIQSTLVSLGDKGGDFLGSRQWIGAIELGFVLDSLLGVECKVITVASGAEMPGKAREIAHHFDTQGGRPFAARARAAARALPSASAWQARGEGCLRPVRRLLDQGMPEGLVTDVCWPVFPRQAHQS